MPHSVIETPRSVNNPGEGVNLSGPMPGASNAGTPEGNSAKSFCMNDEQRFALHFGPYALSRFAR